MRADTLHLGPYVGPVTDHVRIPVGRGVCGTAVAENANQLIDDVSQLDNYLACNLDTKAELVVLVRDDAGDVIGQIDIDGSAKGMFGPEEEQFISAVGDIIADAMASLQQATDN